MLEIITILSLAYIVFNEVVLWKFVVKTGRLRWSLFIPIYSNFVWYDIVGNGYNFVHIKFCT